MKKDTIILFSIIFVTAVFRALLIWLDRPEFVGWFNHTYYYYVQVKGLIVNGSLPYPDMPFLFYIYAMTSKLLMLLGLDINNTIINSTRFWMSIIPSLTAVPVYFFTKNIVPGNKSSHWLWILVITASLLPLNLVHLPEFSQKNVLGLVLFASLTLFVKEYFNESSKVNITKLVVVFIMIILTHFGTAGVTILYSIALLIAYLILDDDRKKAFRYLAVLLAGVFIFTGVVFIFDNDRFYRLFSYILNSFYTSFAGELIFLDGTLIDRVPSFLVLVIPAVVFYLLYKMFLLQKKNISKADQLFWLSSIIFSYLLVLPVYDQLLFARFTIFLSIPLIVVIVYSVNYSIQRRWIRIGLLTSIALLVVLVSFGEIMSLKFHNRNKDEIYIDLKKMKEEISFSNNDLIIAKNGTEHICNWFLGTKAGVITSLNLSDFKTYDRVFVLNPAEGGSNSRDLKNYRVEDESSKYKFMRNNVPKPKDAETVYESKFLQLYLLTGAPEEWEFNNAGEWVSYTKNSN